MLGDSRAGDVEVSGDLAGAELLVADQGQDLPPPRLGNRPRCEVQLLQSVFQVRVDGLI
ncbi:MAG TPA: hypothetical protein VLL27_13720 [Solirubrobacterales bacterium]|nr:hypothetical protein [Solirubrobacterales bacterium]